MKPDPKVRRDGLCVVCERPLPPIAIANGDPFCCSSPCCREFHDNPLPDLKTPRAKGVSMYLDVEWKRRQRANPEFRERERARDRDRRRAERSAK